MKEGTIYLIGYYVAVHSSYLIWAFSRDLRMMKRDTRVKDLQMQNEIYIKNVEIWKNLYEKSLKPDTATAVKMNRQALRDHGL